MYLLNKYTKCYNSIICRATTRMLDNATYFEKHHIIPRCLGGTNDKSNIVRLTAKEHFICHLLLIRMVENRVAKSKLSYAVWQFTKRYATSAAKYENLRIQLSNNTKGIPKSEEHKTALRKPKSNTSKMKGGPGGVKGRKIKGQALTNIRNAVKLQDRSGENNSFYGKHHSEETKQYYRNLFSNVPLSDTHKENISKGLKGKSTWNKGIAMNDSAKQKASQSLSGRITINNGSTNKRVKPENIEEFLSSGWLKGKLR